MNREQSQVNRAFIPNKTHTRAASVKTCAASAFEASVELHLDLVTADDLITHAKIVLQWPDVVSQHRVQLCQVSLGGSEHVIEYCYDAVVYGCG